MNNIDHEEIVSFIQNKDNPYIFDVSITDIDVLSQYDSVECHFVIYPYNRNIFSENITFYPFEEYVKDILSYKNSAYVIIKNHFNKVFGLFVWFLIILVFYYIKPVELLSVEAFVSVIGAYIVGKELREDIDNFLQDITKCWFITFQENYYKFALVKWTTLSNYSYFAKVQRYWKSPLLPKKMNFIEQSNSQTLRIYFDKNDFKIHAGKQAQVTAIHIQNEKLDRFKKYWFMFGVKISLNKYFMWIKNSTELFQSIHNYNIWCLDEKWTWNNWDVFYRKTHSLGKIKYFRKKWIIDNQKLIKFSMNNKTSTVYNLKNIVNSKFETLKKKL